MKKSSVMPKSRPAKKMKAKGKKLRPSFETCTEDQLEADLLARAEGPKRKTWSTMDMRPLRPANDKQADAIQAWVQGSNLALLGSTGTGKTSLGVYLACSSMLRKDEVIDKIIIVRSAVQSRNVGFLPGDLTEKLASYEQPYIDAFASLFGRASTYNDMKDAGKVVFLSTSFLRGVTFENAVILLDESQNCQFDEINTVLSRLGHGSRVILMGDKRQTDLERKEPSGLPAFMEIVKDIKGFDTILFNRHDIVRSGFVRSWIIASEDYFEREAKMRSQPQHSDNVHAIRSSAA